MDTENLQKTMNHLKNHQVKPDLPQFIHPWPSNETITSHTHITTPGNTRKITIDSTNKHRVKPSRQGGAEYHIVPIRKSVRWATRDFALEPASGMFLRGGVVVFFFPERLVGGRLRGGLLVVVEDIGLKRGFRRCFIITEERQIVRRPPKTNHPPGKPTYPSKKTQRGKKEELSFSPGMIC